MPQEDFTPADWVNGLSQCLQELVDYEQRLERELLILRRETEDAYGVPPDSRDDRNDRVRDRIARYWGSLVDAPRAGSEYQRNIYRRLRRLQDVLLEHPTLKGAVYRAAEDLPALGLNMATSFSRSHQLIFVLKGLIDHAVEHTPQATADALAQIIQRGEDRDLKSYQMLLFHGLHVEQKRDFPNGLSIVPFEEVRRYLPDDRIRSMLKTGDRDTNREPIAAVVFERRWGPLIVPAGFEMEGLDWPEKRLTFRDDALVLLSALAVSHGVPVAAAGTRTTVVERRIEHLMGRDSLISRFSSDVMGVNTMRVEPIATPAVSEETLSDCERLLLGCSVDVRLRIALFRLASSLARTGVHGAFDKVLDSAIALEVMYQLDTKRGKKGQLSRRARQFLGGDRENLKWIGRTAESIYDARSSVVHDGTLPADADRIYEDAFELGRRTLLQRADRPLEAV